jgi:hypothetical protein
VSEGGASLPLLPIFFYALGVHLVTYRRVDVYNHCQNVEGTPMFPSHPRDHSNPTLVALLVTGECVYWSQKGGTVARLLYTPVFGTTVYRERARICSFFRVKEWDKWKIFSLCPILPENELPLSELPFFTNTSSRFCDWRW